MENHRFDALIRRLATGRTRRSAFAALSALVATRLATDAPGAARRKKKKKKKKVVVCLNGQSFKVKKKQRNRFLRDGATLGACPVSPPPPPPTSTSTTTTTTTTPAPPLTCAEQCPAGCTHCADAISGAVVCIGSHAFFCPGVDGCTSNAQCGSGYVCAYALRNRATNVNEMMCINGTAGCVLDTWPEVCPG